MEGWSLEQRLQHADFGGDSVEGPSRAEESGDDVDQGTSEGWSLEQRLHHIELGGGMATGEAPEPEATGYASEDEARKSSKSPNIVSFSSRDMDCMSLEQRLTLNSHAGHLGDVPLCPAAPPSLPPTDAENPTMEILPEGLAQIDEVLTPTFDTGAGVGSSLGDQPKPKKKVSVPIKESVKKDSVVDAEAKKSTLSATKKEADASELARSKESRTSKLVKKTTISSGDGAAVAKKKPTAKVETPQPKTPDPSAVSAACAENSLADASAGKDEKSSSSVVVVDKDAKVSLASASSKTKGKVPLKKKDEPKDKEDKVKKEKSEEPVLKKATSKKLDDAESVPPKKTTRSEEPAGKGKAKEEKEKKPKEQEPAKDAIETKPKIKEDDKDDKKADKPAVRKSVKKPDKETDSTAGTSPKTDKKPVKQVESSKAKPMSEDVVKPKKSTEEEDVKAKKSAEEAPKRASSSKEGELGKSVSPAADKAAKKSVVFKKSAVAF